MGSSLCTIDQYWYAACVRKLDHLLNWVDTAQRIRYVHYADKFGVFVKQVFIFINKEFPRIINRNDTYFCTPLFCQHLPRNNIGMMLKHGQNNFITRADKLAAVSMHDQVD